jgi:glycosyltransferase involved in cell wall biosynthesis
MKIGVYFFFKPQDAGAFTSHMFILKAFNDSNYNVVVFTNRKNISMLKKEFPRLEYYILDKYTFYGFCERVLCKLALRKVLPIKILSILNPVKILLTKLKIDLIVFPDSYPAAMLCKKDYIFYVDDLQHKINPQFPEISERSRYKIKDFIYLNTLNRAKSVLTDSKAGKQDVINYYNINPSKIYPLPFVCPYYLSEYLFKVKTQDVRSKYHLPDRFIFYPANLWKHKNHLNLIKAIALLRKRGVIVNAVFCGSKENNFEEIISIIDELKLKNQIYYLGFIPKEHLIGLYKSAVALVMPTFFGPTNIPPLEAFALGCPVAISNVHGIPEQVGDAALLFDPTDIKDIAHKIYLLWTDECLREKLIAKGHLISLKQNQSMFNTKLMEILEATYKFY